MLADSRAGLARRGNRGENYAFNGVRAPYWAVTEICLFFPSRAEFLPVASRTSPWVEDLPWRPVSSRKFALVFTDYLGDRNSGALDVDTYVILCFLFVRQILKSQSRRVIGQSDCSVIQFIN